MLLDNGPLHRSQEFIEQIPKWVKKDLSIKYLPPYSPELNLIEILWRFMKCYWLPFSVYTSFQCLFARFRLGKARDRPGRRQTARGYSSAGQE